jgi:hypothetical protein
LVINNQSAETSFTVRYIKHGIDKWLLDRIDELAGTYYDGNWQITINQYKAWIATITLEGSDGGYAAHSGAKNYDYFIHKDCKNFGFSTGIGPFQLDSIAIGNDNVLNWTTLEKLGYSSYYKEICKNVVEFVLKFHKILFKDNVNLEYFAEKLESIWYVLRKVKEVWERCTGESWDEYKGKKKDIDWNNIKNILAENAKCKEGWDYYQNIRYIGKFYWNVNCDIININGSYPTYLISSRDPYGNLRFRYYYTSFKYNNEDWEIWCLFDNSRYIFLRKIGERIPIPEDGITLDVPAIVPLEYNVMQIIDKALNWLKNQQKEDHTWIYDENNLFKPAMTALASLCFLNYGYDPNKNEFLKNALDTLCNMQNPDGSFGSSHAVYETSMTVIALVAAARMQYKPSNSNLKGHY